MTLPALARDQARGGVTQAAGAARRIGVVLHDFPAGGTERIIVRLANSWAASGRDVTIFCGLAAGPALDLVGPSVTVIESAPQIPRGATSRYRLGRALRYMIANHPVDILIGPGNFHLAVLLAAGRLPCPIVCKLSNPLRRPGRGRIGQLGFAIAARAATHSIDTLIAMSPSLASEARQVLGRPVETIHEPIVGSPPRGSASPATSPLIVCAGRLVPQKNMSLALKAFAALGNREARLLVLGDGEERAALEAESSALGLAVRVTFAGHVPNIAPALQNADALLMSSDYEGYPAVLIEAILAGVPVVTTPCSPAIPEILFHPSFGETAEAEPRALAAALRSVLARGRVNPLARQALAHRHDIDTSAAEWLALLDRVAR